jgi:phosphatidylinositol phospholipase C delta
MSFALLALLVYTVGVKCRGINKKEVYSPEHMFSLSENTANKMIKAGTGMHDLIKHCRTHLVRVYPKGLRLSSTNFEPHRYWSAGAQLVAINWQTFDPGHMINHAMFQRNGRSGYVLKPPALRERGPHNKDLLAKHTNHHFDVSIISAQQLPRPKDSSGREIVDSNKPIIDPFVEVSVHVPDWTTPTSSQNLNLNSSSDDGMDADLDRPGGGARTTTAARTISYRTAVVKNNGFNPVWEEKMRIPFECVGDMLDLIFVRFVVRQGDKEDVEPLAVYCASLGSLGQGEVSFSCFVLRVSDKDDRISASPAA